MKPKSVLIPWLTLLAAVLALPVPCPPAAAAVLEVCQSGACPFMSIQSAIDEAEEYDTILVHEGLYVENIDFLGKEITVRSTKGAAYTTIDGGGAGSVVRDTDSLGEGILDGFTLTNGTGTLRDGVRYGGGVFLESLLQFKLRNCIIRGNTADYGGGVLTGDNYEWVEVDHCRIEENHAVKAGGGVCTTRGDRSIYRHCIIRENTVGPSTGPAYLTGGGMRLAGANRELINCLIVDNALLPGGFGGGVYLDTNGPRSFTFRNCTIAHNSAGDLPSPDPLELTYGGGIYMDSFSPPVEMYNCILWGNEAEKEPEAEISGNGLSAWDTDINPALVSQGRPFNAYRIITSDPLWVPGPGGDYYLSHEATGQDADSPCVNTGGETAVEAGLDDRTTRVDGVRDTDRVDMGFHYTPCSPSIRANGSEGPVVLAPGSSLSISIGLEPGMLEAADADWWLVVFWYAWPSGPLTPVAGGNFLQQPLYRMAETPLFSLTTLPPGVYVFLFAVDTNMNGAFDPARASYDAVAVIVTGQG